MKEYAGKKLYQFIFQISQLLQFFTAFDVATVICCSCLIVLKTGMLQFW